MAKQVAILTTIEYDIGKGHARKAPSDSARWMTCSGSIQLEEKLGLGDGDDSNEASRMGTAAHKLMEICLTKKQAPDQHLNKVIRIKEMKDGKLVNQHDVPVDQYMVNGVEMLCDYVRGIIDDLTKRFKMLTHFRVEQEVYISVIDDEGHIDISIAAGDELHVIDYKNGRGVVEVAGNTQTRLYLLGEAELGKWTWNKYISHIVQPNAAHEDGRCRSETLTQSELMEWADFAQERSDLVDAPNPPLAPSDKGCYWCPVGQASRCPALAEEAIKEARLDFQQFLSPEGDGAPEGHNPHEIVAALTNEQLARAYLRLPLMAVWIEAVEKLITQRAMAGEQLPGLKVVEANTNRRWKDEAETLKAFASLKIDPAAYTKVKPLGLGDAEALLKKHFKLKHGAKEANQMADGFIKTLVIKPKGELTVTTINDPRPAIRVNSAQDDFAEHITP